MFHLARLRDRLQNAEDVLHFYLSDLHFLFLLEPFRIPVILRLLVPVVAGILIAYYFNLSIPFWAVLAFTSLSVFSFLFLKRSLSGSTAISATLFTMLFFCLGVYLEKSGNSLSKTDYFTNHTPVDSAAFFQLRLDDYPQQTDKWIRCKAAIVAADNSPVSGNVQIYLERDSISEKLVYGDLLYVNCRFFEINAPSNPHEFDYRAYLNHQDIHHQAFIRSGNWILFGNEANPLLSMVYQTRSACSDIIDRSGMKPENSAVAKALLLGDKEFINDELMLSYSATGTLHVLAVSGLHVGIVMLILGFILQPVKRLKKGKILFLIFALSGIWFYALLTGFSPSILRATVMFSFVLIGNEMQRDTAIYQSLFVSALILIILDPHILFQVGFLLSYLAVFGIVFFHPKIYPLFCSRYKIIDKSWQLISVSIAAQLSTLPLSLYCFHQFPSYFLVANLLVIPISFVILILGIAALIFYAVPYFGYLLFYVMDFLITLMNEGIRQVEKLPYAVLDGLVIQWFDALILFALLFSIAFTLMKRSLKLLYLTFSLCTLFVVSLLFQKIQRSENHLAVFYTIKNEVMLDVIQGENISCFTTPDLVRDEQKMRFHIYPNRLQSSGSEATIKTTFLTDSTRIISVANKHLLFLNQAKAELLYQEKFPEADLIYLYEAQYIDQPIIDLISTRNIPVIIGPGVSFQLKGYLKKQIEPAKIHDLNKNGAIIVNLESLNAE